MGTPDHTLPISEVSAREITLIPTWRYSNVYPRAIDIARASMSESGLNGIQLPNIANLVTHRFRGLESIHKAFDYASRTRDDDGNLIMKVAVELG